MSDDLCKCGHPRTAHRLAYDGPPDPSGRKTGQESCRATITRRHEHGDDAWPCHCQNFTSDGNFRAAGEGDT